MKGSFVKEKIKKAGFDLKSVAKDMNETPQSLQSLLNAADIKVGVLTRIAKAINKSLNYFTDEEENIVRAPEGKIKRRIMGDKNSKIAFYDADFEAGKGVAFYDDIRNSEPEYYMDVPDFAGCSAFRTYGKSMQPQIEPGAILFGTKEDNWREYLEPGQIYGIVLSDGKRLLKQIKKSAKGNDYFLIKSANPEFDDDDIPKKLIKNIWLIHGWLNKNT